MYNFLFIFQHFIPLKRPINHPKLTRCRPPLQPQPSFSDSLCLSPSSVLPSPHLTGAEGFARRDNRPRFRSAARRSLVVEMNSTAIRLASLLKRPSSAFNSASWSLQQWRGIRVKVLNGNLEQALSFMQRKMTSSGIERMIKRDQTHHIKNSEKRVLARKSLERKIQSQDLARKLKSILIKKVRGL